MLQAVVAFAAAAGIPAGPSAVASGFTTALTACKQWVLEPATWAEGIAEFPARAGLSGRLTAQVSVPPIALPPPALREANHFWHVRAGSSGFYVTVSDRQPMCHIAGGGSEDFFPGLAQAVGGTFSAEWRETSTRVRDGLQSTTFIYKFNKRLTMILTRPKAPNGAKDRVQVIATLNYKLQD